MSSEATVLLSVVTSSVVAAIFTGLFAGSNERKKQLLESRRLLASDFAAEAMGALARIVQQASRGDAARRVVM